MELLELSEFQYSIWKGQNMFRKSPLYNMVFTFDIYGEIEKDKFIEAFNLLVKHTASLNLILDESELNLPKHKIKERAAQVDYIDVQRDKTFVYEEWLNRKNKINFDLTVTSYYSALLKLDNEHYVWYINQHHIFTDAFCFQLLFNRMSAIYQSLITDSSYEIASDKADYIASCNKNDNNEAALNSTVKQIKRDNFSLYGKLLVNPASTESNRFQFLLSDDLIAEIHNFLKALKLNTLAANLDFLAFLMSSLLITMSKVGEQENSYLLSNIFSQRFVKKNKTLVKPLLNILNSEIKWSPTDGYEDLHRKIYAFLIMRKGETTSSNSLLPASIINFFDLRFEHFAGYKTRYIWHHCGHMDSHHSLRFHIFRYQAKDKFTFAFDIKGEPDEQIIGNKFIVDYKNVISKITKNDKPIQLISLLAENELTKLNTKATALNQSKISTDNYFINVLKLKAKQTPNAIALYDLKEQITYEELLKQATIFAEKINAIVPNSDSKIAIYLPKSKEFIYALIGSLLQGGSFIPLAYNLPKARVRYILEDVGAHLLIEYDKEVEIAIAKINLSEVTDYSPTNEETFTSVGQDFYTLYTSGSSGKPKGVPITQHAFTSYLTSIKHLYLKEERAYNMPLFTSVGFDLTMTSIFLPLYTGGSISIYRESEGIDVSIRSVIGDERLNCFKCTPSHLKLIEGLTVNSNIQSIIVGGENFSRQAATLLAKQSNNTLNIFNEYGPTECTVGCIVHQFNHLTFTHLLDVPIGKPLNDCVAFVADEYGAPVTNGVIGELCVAGQCLSKGYVNDNELTAAKYINNNQFISSTYYRTGDFVRLNEANVFEFLGRKDEQIKVQGIRIEKGEIEEVVQNHIDISSCVVVHNKKIKTFSADYIHCAKCGLPSNYPNSDFDTNNVCSFCRNYEAYEKKVEKYFKSENKFTELFNASKSEDSEYDCIMLFSGGKDSTYALAKLVAMGLKVLAFTLDNGYISENAKDNIKRVTNALDVDCMFGTSPAMNEIFVDSLKTHCNVCNGCFKTIYNLSLKVAFEKKIPIIVTGLSRGQFFETKLSEEIFWKPMDDVEEIDQTLFAAREAYHSVKDVAYEKTDGAFIEENNVLQSVKIVDFYRYHDVTLENLLDYINTKLPWVRPEDTGRSTNCLINKVGIYIHKQEKGYSNYAFPYSWDVRTGHKTKEETIDEIEEVITENDVSQIINEIGYEKNIESGMLIAYYTGEEQATADMRKYVSKYLPDYMVPNKFVCVDEIPVTPNGKVDYKQLENIKSAQVQTIRKPTNELEELLVDIWKEVLLLDEISIDSNFFELGGTSLHAIRIVARIEKELDYQLGVQYIFQIPTIETLSEHILQEMQNILAANTD